MDTGARVLAPHMEAHLKQPVIVENRPGSNNAVSAHVAASAAPDGMTQFFGMASSTTAVFIKDFPLDFMKDFNPVAGVNAVSYMLFINPSVPARNTQGQRGEDRQL